MTRRFPPPTIALLACLTLLAATVRADEAAETLFARRVRPLLSAKCLPCHGAKANELQGGFDLRSREGMVKGGESGLPAFDPMAPEKSPLLRAVLRKDDEFTAMPPKDNDQLTAEEIGWLREWLKGGASWPSPERAKDLLAKSADAWQSERGTFVVTSGGLSPEWTDRKYLPENLWAYRPVARPDLPKLPHDRRSANAVDAFIEAKLLSAGLEPAPLADRRVLVRRVTFDLTGLPPTPEEVRDFVSDRRDDDQAYAALVDRLLASPHYGEQWARHWLDVARYADTSGFANDYARGAAWRYRDYVVRAFNADKPYDQFVREQIAGDEIDDRNPELLVAVGFLRMGPWELTGMEVPKIARQRFLDDITDSVGQTFLAHPLQCARCHDHKFDPVPTRDYYGLQACFATTQFADRPAAFLPSESLPSALDRRHLEQRREHYQGIIDRLQVKLEEAGKAWAAERGLPYVSRVKGLKQGIAEEKLPPKNVGFSVEDFGIERIARKGLERLKWEFDRYEPVALSVYSGATPALKSVNEPLRLPSDLLAGEVEQTAILAGGDPFSPTQAVNPCVLSVVGAGAEMPATVMGRRLALANWIALPTNPLTSRVMVNRLWHWHFGQGLAANPSNFGATGKKPANPELLDWLAAELVTHGWSIKHLQRLIVTSRTYRRASQHPQPESLDKLDPNGALCAVFKQRRLDAEELRDAMLAASGELNAAIGGPPVRPEMNREAATQPRQVMGTFAEAWQPSPLPEQRHRRSLYALRIRGLRDPLFDVFNLPGSESSCEAREASTVAPQALALFNGETSNDRALAMAARLSKELAGKPRKAVVARAFELAFARPPRAAESDACLAHWDAMISRHKTLQFVKQDSPREIVREAVEENTGEKFQFSEPLEAAADFVPDLKPADASPEVRGLAEVCLVLMNANEFVYVD